MIYFFSLFRLLSECEAVACFVMSNFWLINKSISDRYNILFYRRVQRNSKNDIHTFVIRWTRLYFHFKF